MKDADTILDALGTYDSQGQPYQSPLLFTSATKSVGIREKRAMTYITKQDENRKGRWTVRESEMQSTMGRQPGCHGYHIHQLPSSYSLIFFLT